MFNVTIYDTTSTVTKMVHMLLCKVISTYMSVVFEISMYFIKTLISEKPILDMQ